MAKATLQDAARVITGNPNASLQDAAQVIVDNGGVPGGGGGAVASVNGQTGDVVLTGDNINATLTNGETSDTSTITEHLQTLKNDEGELGNQISGIQALIPSDASDVNLLATKSDIPDAGVTEIFHDDSLTGSGTETSPLSVARPSAIIREW